jgi:hypothetical protein
LRHALCALLVRRGAAAEEHTEGIFDYRFGWKMINASYNSTLEFPAARLTAKDNIDACEN